MVTRLRRNTKTTLFITLKAGGKTQAPYWNPAVATYAKAAVNSSRSSNVYQSVSSNGLSLHKMTERSEVRGPISKIKCFLFQFNSF